MKNNLTPTPKELGYYFPAEFSRHDATWLSWPHNKETWPGKLDKVYPFYSQFVKELAVGEKVCINLNDAAMRNFALQHLEQAEVDLSKVEFFEHPTNDAWCRDHGPAFLINPQAVQKKIIVDWQFNAWGRKYPPYDKDDVIPTLIAKHYGIPVFYPGIVMEGGSVEFNGKGTVITSRSCLLKENRNPHLNQAQIEQYLCDYYGLEQVLWVDHDIAGDDTDGHIDDTVRFVNQDTVLAVIEENQADENYKPLQQNLTLLQNMHLLNGKQLNIIPLPMPEPVVHKGRRLPASYANFYVANHVVIVPTFQCGQDDEAMQIISRCFPQRKVIGIDSTDIVWGLGSFHCLSQQEPSV